MSESSDDRKAKEILSSLSQREPVGDRILRSLGGRLWGRLNVATSPRLFALYDIPDPYQPEGFDSKWAIKLGPVSLRLGENRREPAPHLKVREPKKPKSSSDTPPQFKPKGVPAAKKSPPKPEVKPPPVKTEEPPKPIPKSNAHVPRRAPSISEFGMGPEPPTLSSLPMRPDLLKTLIDKGVSLPPHLQAQYEQMKDQKVSEASTGNERGSPQNETDATRHSLPKRKSSARTSQKGRIRMRPQRRSKPALIKSNIAPEAELPKENSSSSNLETQLAGVTKPQQSEPLIPEKVSPPPPRTPPGRGNMMSIDDMFGFAGQERMRVGRPRKKKEGLKKDESDSSTD